MVARTLADPHDRVAVQAAVLTSLRSASAADVVWPGTTISELYLDAAAIDRVVEEVARTLAVEVASSMVEAAATVGTFIDALVTRGPRVLAAGGGGGDWNPR